MSWQTEWGALSNRIVSTMEAATFLTRMGVDGPNVSRVLILNAKDTYQELKKFHDAYAALLPDRAAGRLSSFLEDHSHWYSKIGRDSGVSGRRDLPILAPLASFRAEFTHLISDTAAVARSLVERAVLHLQRGIVADEDVARKWRAAFDHGETACERLGSVHFLLHGIWAFKVSASGERTDLVFGRRLEITPQICAGTEAMVLTEWKVVRGDTEAQAVQALKQAKRYVVGCLAGYELESIRYLVLVSEDVIDLPEDVQEGSVTYHYVNISVRPGPPSAIKTPKPAGGTHDAARGAGLPSRRREVG
jgi:hypothetical protein